MISNNVKHHCDTSHFSDFNYKHNIFFAYSDLYLLYYIPVIAGITATIQNFNCSLDGKMLGKNLPIYFFCIIIRVYPAEFLQRGLRCEIDCYEKSQRPSCWGFFSFL